MSRIAKTMAIAAVLLLTAAIAVFAHDGIHEQIVAVTEEIKKDPKNASLYLKRAELYRLHREWTRSEADLNRVARLDPNLTIVSLRRGLLYYDSRRFVQARRALEKYLAADPDVFDAELYLARTLAKLGDAARSADHFSSAIRLSPSDSAELYVERADVLARAGRFSAAIAGLDEGIAKLGPLVIFTSRAIEIEVKLKRFDDAVARLDKLIASAPRPESYLLQKGEILLAARRTCEARKALLESKAGYDSRTSFQRGVRAVRDQIARLETLLKRTASCAEKP